MKRWWLTLVAACCLFSNTLAATITVPNVADLADARVGDGDLVQTAGQVTADDGGGMLYRYDAGSAAVADGVLIVTGPGGVGRYLSQAAERAPLIASTIPDDGNLLFDVTRTDATVMARTLSLEELKKTGVQVVNVLQYGADPTGVGSSTTAFSDAVAALPAAGGVIYIPSGTYTGELTLSSKSNVTIVGDGRFSRLNGGGAGYNCIDLVSCDNVTIRNLYLYGSGDSAAASVQVDNGIFAHTCTKLIVDNVRIENHGFAGISLYNCSTVKLTNNIITAASGDTSINAADIYCSGNAAISNYVISGNECTSGNATGIGIQPSTANVDHKHFVISGNICTGHDRYGIICYATLSAGTDDTIKGATVVGNTVESNGWGGIYFQSVEDSTIVGNATRDNDSGGSGSGIEGGIHVNGSVGISVTGNTCYDENGSAIKITGHSSYTERRHGVTVSGNVVRNQTTTGHPSIYVNANMTECAVVGNSVFGATSQAIYIQGTSGVTKYVTIVGNNIDCNSGTNRGIDLDGSTISGIVAGNKIVNCGTGLRVSDGNILRITNNIMQSNTTDLAWNGTLDNLQFTGNVYTTMSGTQTITTPSFSASDTTPSVMSRHRAQTANAAPTTISALDDGVDGQVVTILINDANTTVDFTGTTLKGNNGVYWTPASGDHMTCTKIGSNWYCDISEN